MTESITARGIRCSLAAILFFSGSVALAQAQLDGWVTVHDWGASGVAGVFMKVKCQKTIHQFNVYFRNDSKATVHLRFDFDNQPGGAFTLVPGQVKGGDRDGMWTMGSSCSAIPRISVADADYSVSSAIAKDATHDIGSLPAETINELRAQDEVLRAHGFAARLLVMSPLSGLLQSDAVERLKSLSEADWDDVRNSLNDLDKITASELAIRCLNMSSEYRIIRNDPLAEFWSKLAQQYQNAARHRQ